MDEILPRYAPVMPLSGALLFPNALLPLYIFEERYRAMLEYALAHSICDVTEVRARLRDLHGRAKRFLN